MSRRLPVLALCLLLAPAAGRAASATPEALCLDWCTGVSPISWGFSVTPKEDIREVRLEVASSSVSVVSASTAASLPEGWAVSLKDAHSVVASGPTPLPPNVLIRTFFVLETDRATSGVDSRGARPVQWKVTMGSLAPSSMSFPATLELSDAVSRGIVLATVEPLSPWGPVEVTVDNPTLEPLNLDLPPGTILRGDGQDWVVALVKPFQMEKRQKTGRTISAFPVSALAPNKAAPRRLALSTKTHENARLLTELGLAVRRLQEAPEANGRKVGEFEYWEGFDFWPLVLQWAYWRVSGDPSRDALVERVRALLAQRVSSGDRHAALEPVDVAGEIDRAAAVVTTLVPELAASPLPLPVQASLARSASATTR